jgi:hypothetical protein
MVDEYSHVVGIGPTDQGSTWVRKSRGAVIESINGVTSHTSRHNSTSASIHIACQ